MIEQWHTIKVKLSDEDWLHWRLVLLTVGTTADEVVSEFMRQYAERNKPVGGFPAPVVKSKPTNRAATRRSKKAS